MATGPASTNAATAMAQGSTAPAASTNSSPPSPTFSDKLYGTLQSSLGKLSRRPGLEKEGEVRKSSGREAARRERDAQRGRTEEGSTTTATGTMGGGAGVGGGAGQGGQEGTAGMGGGGLETVQ